MDLLDRSGYDQLRTGHTAKMKIPTADTYRSVFQSYDDGFSCVCNDAFMMFDQYAIVGTQFDQGLSGQRFIWQ